MPKARSFTAIDWKRLSQLYDLIMHGTEPTDPSLRKSLTLPASSTTAGPQQLDHLQAENKRLRHEIKHLRAQLKKMPSPYESDSFA